MKLKDALRRIEELERKVCELEARPPQVFEYHYHQPALVGAPQPVYVPVYPQPYFPQPWMGYATWGAAGSPALLGMAGMTFNGGN